MVILFDRQQFSNAGFANEEGVVRMREQRCRRNGSETLKYRRGRSSWSMVGVDAWHEKYGFVDPSINDPAAWVNCAWLRDDVWLRGIWKGNTYTGHPAKE